jgi:pimeloyl-ACP methyl ester carboxylesterase
LFFPSKKEEANKLIIYFHGNAENMDSEASIKLVRGLQMDLDVHFVLVEYPGYGMYKGKPNAPQIESNALDVFDYFKEQCNSDQIIIIGRSMGSGPATYVAHIRNIGALVLISAFMSIKGVVKNLFGFLKLFVKERFRNIERIRSVKAPCLFIHGEDDELIPYWHSERLIQNCPA